MTREANGRGPADSRQLRAEVELAREQLADTVAELAAKADMKSLAQEKAAEVRTRALFRANEAKVRVRHTAEQAAHRSWSRPGPAIAGVVVVGAAAMVAFLVLHRQRGRRWLR